jgi:DNA/RNA non-specific endonuclease
VTLANGQTATRTQGMQVTVTRDLVRPAGAARETQPPPALKTTMPGYDNRYKLQLGHLWADRLGGPNAARNFVPGHRHTNAGGMAYVEGRVAAAVREHGSVRLVALPQYVGNEPIPRSILYAWKAPGETDWTAVTIRNLP